MINLLIIVDLWPGPPRLTPAQEAEVEEKADSEEDHKRTEEENKKGEGCEGIEVPGVEEGSGRSSAAVVLENSPGEAEEGAEGGRGV